GFSLRGVVNQTAPTFATRTTTSSTQTTDTSEMPNTIGTSDIGTLKLGDDNDSRTVQQVYHTSDPIPTANMSADLRDRASADVGSEPSEGNHKSALKPEDRHHVTKLMRSDAELGYAIQAKR
ncbi:hypothetical protein THAOC_00165, partial [Thalassiosira oceanica]